MEKAGCPYFVVCGGLAKVVIIPFAVAAPATGHPVAFRLGKEQGYAKRLARMRGRLSRPQHEWGGQRVVQKEMNAKTLVCRKIPCIFGTDALLESRKFYGDGSGECGNPWLGQCLSLKNCVYVCMCV